MSFIWGLLVGIVFMWLFMKYVYATFFKGSMLKDHLRQVSPDAFSAIRKAVDQEASRRNSLL